MDEVDAVKHSAPAPGVVRQFAHRPQPRFTGDGVVLRTVVIITAVLMLGVALFAGAWLILNRAMPIVTQIAGAFTKEADFPQPPVARTLPEPPAPPTIGPPNAPLQPAESPGAWVTNDDYPAGAIRAGQQGVVGFRLSIGTDGRPKGCEVTTTSGVPLLDAQSCRLLVARARFQPARDAQGRAIPATYSSRFRWELP
ncbi:energy transducer TonB [Sphingomonas sp. CJ20]